MDSPTPTVRTDELPDGGTLYVCEIALEIFAESPEDAVREAEGLLDDPVNRGFVWTVRDTRTGISRDVDATELPEH